jgi:hypothetical protein
MNTIAFRTSTGKSVYIRDKDLKRNEIGVVCINKLCRRPVFARRGDIKAWHFAHTSPGGSTSGICTGRGNGGESDAHFDAKYFLADNIAQCAFMQEKCPECTKVKYHVGTLRVTAEVEGRLGDSLFRADVLLRDVTGTATHALEVFHTHAVSLDDPKRIWCTRNNIIIIEATTDAIQQSRRMPLTGIGIRFRINTVNRQTVRCESCQIVYIEHQRMEMLEKDRLDRFQHSDDRMEKVISFEKEWIAGHNRYAKQMFDKFVVGDARTRNLRIGFKRARDHPERPPGRNPHSDSKCLGKCKICEEWLYEEAHVVVYSHMFTEGEWEDLFENTPHNFCTSYYKVNACVKLCTYCTAKCIGCDLWMSVEKMKVYGACMVCCSRWKTHM